jgi:ABC-2 type transport system permease protein
MAAEWTRGYALVLRWQALRQLPLLPVTVIAQTLIGAGAVLGFSLLLPGIDSQTALYLTTGAPTVALITVGLVIVTQEITQAKVNGDLDYMAALPLPRLVYPVALFTVFFGLALPGMLLSVIFGALRFHFALHPEPLLVPAVFLVGLTATAIGHCLALASPNALVASLVTTLVIFAVMLFSPIDYPASHLPGWLAALHQGLPVQHMATLVRETLTGGATSALAWLAVGGWCAAALVLASLVSPRGE